MFDRAAHEAGRGLAALVRELLYVGVARVIVDAGAQEGVAGAPVSVGLRALACGAMAEAAKARQASVVDVSSAPRRDHS